MPHSKQILNEKSCRTKVFTLNKIVLNSVLVCLLASLVACTGSNEARASGIELVLAINPSQTPTTAGTTCLSTPITGPGLLILDTDRMTGQGTDPAQRCIFQPLESAPYSVITSTRSPAGDSLIVSLPQVGKVQEWPASLSAPIEYTPPLTMNDFCPTQLSISPDGTLIAALDDPNITDIGCASSRSQARILVWKRSAPTQAITLSTALPFQANAGPVALALSNTSLFAFSPLAGQYRLSRYALSNSTPQTLDTELVSQQLAPIAVNGTQQQTKLLLLESNLYISFGNSFGGRSLLIQSNTNVLPQNDLQINNQIIGNVQNMFSNARTDGTNQPTLAFTTSSTLRFARNNTLTTPLSISARDITFTPDGFAWVLGMTGGLTQYDTVSLENLTPSSSPLLNTSLNARNLSWIQRP